jgi:cytochrome c biogenesis protein CcmG, thiol:disulfide interchange protein DsbE
MDTYYTLLDLPAAATAEEVAQAYQRKRERYSPERVAALGDEFRRIAETRTAELDQAYAVLSDAGRRAEYDRRIGRDVPAPGQRAGGGRLSRREILMAIGGGLVGLLAIALVWALSSRSAQPALPPVGEVNKPAPEFALPGLDGKEVRLSDYRGKVVLVNFWGTWCEPCKDETPALQAAYQKLADQGLVIIGVDLRSQERDGAEGADDVRSFTERYGVTYPIALDVAGEAARAFQIYPIPTSYFIDPNGQIRYVRVSTLSTAEVELIFQKLQEAKSALR